MLGGEFGDTNWQFTPVNVQSILPSKRPGQTPVGDSIVLLWIRG